MLDWFAQISLQNVTPRQLLRHDLAGRAVDVRRVVELDFGHGSAFRAGRELNRSMMQQDDLLRQCQPETEAGRFPGLEWNEESDRGIEAGTVVFDRHAR